jgi:hypothetical protein
MRSLRPSVIPLLGLALVSAGIARGADAAADDLLRLVPPDAGVTLAVADLRGHVREFLASPLADGLGRLPAVEAWLASPRYRQFETARGEIEGALGVGLAAVRDDLLGDAAVLALRLAPGDPPEQARGLLLLRARGVDLLRRLVDSSNMIERRSGRLVGLTSRARGEAAYTVRTFAPGGRPEEFYAIFPDGTFAWTNSETMIQGVIDRKAGAPGLGGRPEVVAVRRALPGGPAALLLVDPRFLERVLASNPRAARGEDEPAGALLRRYLGAVAYAGAALEWRDGFVLHVHETIDPARLDEPLRRWAARPGGTDSLVRRVPATALAVAAGHFDFAEIPEALRALAPEADRRREDLLVTVLRGLLLDKDPLAEVLPRLGPGVLAYLDTPGAVGPGGRPPLVAALDLGGEAGDPGVAAALGNALRTILALYALDPSRKDLPLRVESREMGGVRVTTLAGAQTPLAFAVARGVLVLGTSAEAVAGWFAGPGPGGSPDFREFRAAFFPRATTFAFADLRAIARAADAHRPELARDLARRRGDPEEAARRDLDGALALLKLFRAAFATNAIAPDFSSVHRTAGLIAGEPAGRP